ncbi:hypothetical protein FQN54_008600 [Arachnomyces sp. PD_36]|nr:hypothetical protein FQN54_008600 [Arachnomyces sp. PD_36]
MSYYPPHNGQHPQQYQYPQQPQPQQQRYNTDAPQTPYRKPAIYPQVVIPSPSPSFYQNHRPLQPQPPPQYANSPVYPQPSHSQSLPPLQYAPPPLPQYDGAAASRQYNANPPNPNTPQPYPRYPPQPPPQPRSISQPDPQHATLSPQVQVQVQVPQQRPPTASSQRSLSQTPKLQAKALPKHQSAEDAAKRAAEYQIILLSLAEEYFDAAHSQGTGTALGWKEADMEEYYKLVATGLGCLEAVLKNWRLQPRREALVRLQYARILFEETENDSEAEAALSKGIDLCERNGMLDLKYNMQQLLARLLYKSNPKAAMKTVDGMIQDVETYGHVAWEYAFRLLRVTFSLSSSHLDFVSAIHNLQKISALANRNGDRGVYVVASVIEALAYLQNSPGPDSLEHVQRALATARSHQLNSEIRDIPQISTLIQIVDICCSLLEYDIDHSAEKLQEMQSLMDEKLDDPHWQSDGSFSIPLSSRNAGPSSVENGDILRTENGTLVLTLSWLPEHDLYTLCYFLSSVTLSAKNAHNGRKAEKFLDEGLRMVKTSFKDPPEISEPLTSAQTRFEWRRILYCNLLLQLIFLSSGRTDWELAKNTLQELRQATEDLGENIPNTLQCLMEYADGIISQGTGDLDTALTAFQNPIFSLPSFVSKTARNDPRRDTAILAALNTILILREPSHPSHSRLPSILSTLEPFCKGSPNKYIQAAYYLVCATVQTDSTIKTKQNLQHALQAATAICNSQITCITLTFMSWKYFRGVIGEQSEKSAKAGRATAKKANDRLWVSVADEMLAETLERQGKGVEAKAIREEGDRVMAGLPQALKRAG